MRTAAAVFATLWLALAAPAATAAAPATREPAFEITTVHGDTVIGLARRWLARPARWPELARANALRNPDRIPTGSVLRIPLRLMRTEAVPATLLEVAGQVAGPGPGALQAGQAVPEGGEVDTGPDGQVTIRLVDGTLLRLRADSQFRLRESLRIRDAGVVRSGATLNKGRVEIEAAPAPAGQPGFSIDTPQGLLGVRGTEFRVATDPLGAKTRGEVLAGVVAFSGRGAGGPSERVGAGFGTVIGADGAVAPPVRLLAPPSLGGLPTLQERLLVRFSVPPVEGAVAYRGQIASDASFDTLLADLSSATPELRFAGLPDGNYALRVRAVDATGLEGRDAELDFRLKARPEAPLPSVPAPRAVSFGGRAEFAWAANTEADRYRLQLATGADFKAPLRDLMDLRGLAITLEGLPPGTYHWRLRSVRADGDEGPWGDARSFELRPLPSPPKPPRIGDHEIAFAWDGLPGQSFDFEVARDAAFADTVFARHLDHPAVELPLPGTGRFYVRLRARDPDGFVGPYTTPQYVDIPNCLRDTGGACVRAAGETLNLAP